MKIQVISSTRASTKATATATIGNECVCARVFESVFVRELKEPWKRVYLAYLVCAWSINEILYVICDDAKRILFGKFLVEKIVFFKQKKHVDKKNQVKERFTRGKWIKETNRDHKEETLECERLFDFKTNKKEPTRASHPARQSATEKGKKGSKYDTNANENHQENRGQ